MGKVLAGTKADEIFQLGQVDLKHFWPTSLILWEISRPAWMPVLLGILINTICGPIESPLKDYGLTQKNLCAYCNRMMSEFFPELVAAK